LNEKSIPKDWIKVSEHDKKSGFHGKAFYKNGNVVFARQYIYYFLFSDA